MSEDIHKWATDGRYVLMFDEHTFFVWDNERDERMCALEVTEKLNEQQATIKDLNEENEQLKIANARWLDKSLQDKQIRYDNLTCNELTKKYLQLKEENEQLKNYFKKRAECSNFQINKLKEEIAELQEDNVDTIVELSKENEQLAEENKQLHYKIIELQDKLGMSEKVIDDE